MPVLSRPRAQVSEARQPAKVCTLLKKLSLSQANRSCRHVRVHHTDKDKDDPQLRDVLAQRPEGGSRGRRRRVSDSGH
jgi:hypothetical protein